MRILSKQVYINRLQFSQVFTLFAFLKLRFLRLIGKSIKAFLSVDEARRKEKERARRKERGKQKAKASKAHGSSIPHSIVVTESTIMVVPRNSNPLVG